MHSFPITSIISRLDDHAEGHEPYWECPAYNNDNTPCSIWWAKHVEKDKAHLLRQLFRDFHEKKDHSESSRCQALEDVNCLLEKLACKRHRPFVFDTIQNYLRQPLSGIAFRNNSLEAATETAAEEEDDDVQEVRPTTPQKAIYRRDNSPVTPPPRSQAQFLPRNLLLPGNVTQITDNLRTLSVSSPWSEVSTPASSVGSVFSTTKTPFTPDTAASNVTRNLSRTPFSETPTKKIGQGTLPAELEDDEDDDDDDDLYTEDIGDLVTTQNEVQRTESGTRKYTQTSVKPLNLPQLRAQRDTLESSDQGKPPASSQPQELPEEDRFERHGKTKWGHFTNTGFYVMELVEREWGKSDKGYGVIYIAKAPNGELNGHYKVGFTSDTVHKRYESENCNTMEFVYRSPEPFKGAFRVEQLVHREFSPQRRHISPCPMCGGNHHEWFYTGKDNMDKLRESVERWTRFVHLAYKDGKLSDEGDRILNKLWGNFAQTLGAETKAAKCDGLVRITPPRNRHDMRLFEEELEIEIQANKTQQSLMRNLGKTHEHIQRERLVVDTTLKQRDSANREVVAEDGDKDKPQGNQFNEFGTEKDTHKSKAKSRPLDALKDLGRRMKGGSSKWVLAAVELRSPIDTETVGPKIGIQRRWTDFLGKNRKH